MPTPPDQPQPQENYLANQSAQVFDLESGNRLRETHLPLDQIRPEEVMLDVGYLTAMRDGIEQAGQATPIKVTTLESGDVVVVDGFYRLTALKELGQTDVRAFELPTMSDEELLDARIQNTFTHLSPELSRIVDWTSQSWSMTPWNEKISVAKAASLYSRLGSGERLGLSDKEANDIKSWMRDKCEKWNVSHSTLTNCLSATEGLHPDLISMARLSVSGRGDSRHLSLAHLREIGRRLPTDREAQRKVGEITLRHGFAATALHQVLKLAKEPGTSFAAAAQQVENARKALAKTKSEEVEAKKAAYDAKNRNYQGGRLRTGPPVFRSVAESDALRNRHPSAAHHPSSSRTSAPKDPAKTSAPRHLRAVASDFMPEPQPEPQPTEPRPKRLIESSAKRQMADRAKAPVEVKPGFTRFGRVVFHSEDLFSRERATGRILRIANLAEVNQLTKELTEKFELAPNKIEIISDELVNFNGQSVEPGPANKEALNILLATYMIQPPSLKELATKYHYGSYYSWDERQDHLKTLHKTLARWKVEGMVFYNPENRKLAGLQPVYIKDRRQA